MRPAVGADADFVGVLFTGQCGGRHTRTDLDPFDGVDRHHGAGEVLIELGVEWRAPAGRHAFGDNLDDGADRGPGFANLIEVIGPGFGGLLIRREERVATDLIPVPAGPIDVVGSDLDECAANCDPRNDFARDRAGRNARCGFARRRAAAASIIADAVLRVSR